MGRFCVFESITVPVGHPPVLAAEGAAASLENRMIGAAPVMVAFAYSPIARGERALSDVFPGGMRQGLGLYYPVKPTGRRFDQLWPAAPGMAFDLLICPPDGSGECDVPVPNIT